MNQSDGSSGSIEARLRAEIEALRQRLDSTEVDCESARAELYEAIEEADTKAHHALQQKKSGHQILNTASTQELSQRVKYHLRDIVEIDSVAIVRTVRGPSGAARLTHIVEADAPYQTVRGKVFPSHMTLTGKAMETHQPEYVSDAKTRPNYLPERVSPDAAEVAFPILSLKDDAIGAVFLRKEPRGSLTRDHREALKAYFLENAPNLRSKFNEINAAYDDQCQTLLRQQHSLALMTSAYADTMARHEPFTVCYFDIDDFKQVNQELGHFGADEALFWLSVGIGQHIRGSDILARHAGDQFQLAFPGRMDSDRLEERIRELQGVGSQVSSLQAEMAPATPQSLKLPPGYRIGLTAGYVTAEPRSGASPSVSQLLVEASRALSEAKGREKGSILKYDI